ncbi:MAG: gamma-glutamyltransferase family protein [Gaiellales bacterium]
MPSRTAASGALAIALVAISATVGAQAALVRDDTRPVPERQTVAVGTGGAVATADPVATRAGIEVLRSGGNAVDAAVATAAVLGVTEPWVAGLGGTGYMTIYRSREDRAVVIGDRAPAPQAFGRDDRAKSHIGNSPLVVGVPTTPMTWSTAIEHFGSISMRQALTPAIKIARAGFVVDQAFHDTINGQRGRFKAFTSTRSLFFDSDLEPLPVGSVFRNPGLATAYDLIARDGVEAFYEGPIARAIVDTIKHAPVAPDAEKYMYWPYVDRAREPGDMELSDLARYRQPVVSPTHVDYRGFDVYSNPPPSSGGSTVGEALNILEGFDLSGPDRALALHRFIEASRLAYADRERYVADPHFVDIPLEQLLSKGYADERRCLIGEWAMAAPVDAGDPTPPYDAPCSDGGSSAAEGAHEGSTTHFSVADRWGNVVSYTTTLVATGGNAIVVPGYGFFFNNELVNFNEEPLFEGDPNLAEGGKRPRGNMAPTVVVRDGRPVLSVGVAGGQTIQTTVLGIMVNHLDFGMPLPEALAAARATPRNTATTAAERGFLDQYGAALSGRFGQRLASTGSIAHAQGISFLPDGRLVAVADTRRAPTGAGDARVVVPDG